MYILYLVVNVKKKSSRMFDRTEDGQQIVVFSVCAASKYKPVVTDFCFLKVMSALSSPLSVLSLNTAIAEEDVCHSLLWALFLSP